MDSECKAEDFQITKSMTKHIYSIHKYQPPF